MTATPAGRTHLHLRLHHLHGQRRQAAVQRLPQLHRRLQRQPHALQRRGPCGGRRARAAAAGRRRRVATARGRALGRGGGQLRKAAQVALRQLRQPVALELLV